MRTVYTIVFLEESGEAFHELQDRYIHRSSQVFDTGLQAGDYSGDRRIDALKEVTF